MTRGELRQALEQIAWQRVTGGPLVVAAWDQREVGLGRAVDTLTKWKAYTERSETLKATSYRAEVTLLDVEILNAVYPRYVVEATVDALLRRMRERLLATA
jgi:hypothetical protein